MRKFLRLLLFFSLSLYLGWQPIYSMGLCLGTPKDKCAYASDPYLREKKASCDGLESRCWDCRLHRCMTSEQSLELREAFEACSKIEDEQQRTACFHQEAEDKTGVSQGEGVKDAKGNIGLTLPLTTIYALLLGVSTTSWENSPVSSTKTCASKWIYMGAAGVHVAAHLWYKRSAKKQFKKLAKEYEVSAENNNPDELNSVDAQRRSFQFLKDEQKLVLKWAKKRKALYTTLIGTYLIATGMAIYETFFNKANACYEDDGQDESDESLDGDQADQKVASNEGSQNQGKDGPDKGQDQTAKTKDGKSGEDGGDTGDSKGDEAAKALGLDQALKLGSSPQNIIASSISSMLATALRSGAAKEAKKAKENIKTINEIMAKFKEQTASFCKSRSDMNVPECYCYNEDGTANKKGRSKSNICKKFWENREKKYNIAASDYRVKKEPRKGCVALNKKFDPDCKCRKFTDKKTGENACFKTHLADISIGNLGTIPGLANITKDLNGLAQGDLASGNFNSSFAAKNAIAAKHFKKKMDAALHKKRKQQGKGPFPFRDENLVKMLNRAKVPKSMKSQGIAASVGSLASANRPTSEKTTGALKNAEKKAGLNGKLFFKNSAKKRRKKKKKSFDFNFNDPSPHSSGKVTRFMEENYDYKENDIVKRDNVSIFEVISNRYQQSGLRRLFGE